MKISWGIGIASAYVVFALSMIGFVIKASQQNNDLVSSDYYEDAVNYQQRIDNRNNANHPGSGIEINYLEEENSLKIISAAGSVEGGNIFFYKPDNAAKDFEKSFSIVDDSVAYIPLQNVSSGKWKLKISWRNGEKNYYTETSVLIK